MKLFITRFMLSSIEVNRMKVIVILPDGMRPDSLTDIANAQKIIGESSYSMDA